MFEINKIYTSTNYNDYLKKNNQFNNITINEYTCTAVSLEHSDVCILASHYICNSPLHILALNYDYIFLASQNLFDYHEVAQTPFEHLRERQVGCNDITRERKTSGRGCWRLAVIRRRTNFEGPQTKGYRFRKERQTDLFTVSKLRVFESCFERCWDSRQRDR